MLGWGTWHAVYGMLLFRKDGVAFALEPRANGLFECVHLAEGYACHLEAIERRRKELYERRARAKALPQPFGPPGLDESLRLAVRRARRHEQGALAAGDAAAAAEHAARAEVYTLRRYEASASTAAGLLFLLGEARRRLRAVDPLDLLLRPLGDVRADIERCPYDPLFPAVVDLARAALAGRDAAPPSVDRILATVAASLRTHGPAVMLDPILRPGYRATDAQPWRTRLPYEYEVFLPSADRLRFLAGRSIRDA